MIEKLILQNLMFNEEYSRRVLPFLTPEYFIDVDQRNVYELIDAYIKKYNSVPSAQALEIDAENKPNITDGQLANIKQMINELTPSATDMEWLIDQSEKFCQDKAIYNAVMNSIRILDGRDKKFDKGAIPQLLSDALGVSFDNNIGHDFLENVDERYEFYHKKENRVPFDLEYFNKITKGGLPPKTLNVALAGCVHPDTLVRVRFKPRSSNVAIL